MKKYQVIGGQYESCWHGESNSLHGAKIIAGKNNTIYHIDCGCVFGRKLGCLRLDDMQEFYVDSTYARLG